MKCTDEYRDSKYNIKFKKSKIVIFVVFWTSFTSRSFLNVQLQYKRSFRYDTMIWWFLRGIGYSMLLLFH